MFVKVCETILLVRLNSLILYTTKHKSFFHKVHFTLTYIRPLPNKQLFSNKRSLYAVKIALEAPP